MKYKTMQGELAMRTRRYEGMSLRDHFARLAMQSLMPVYWETDSEYDTSAELVKCQCETAYEYADAMLEERKDKV